MKEAEFIKEYRHIINFIAETIEANDPEGEIEVDLNADILTVTNKDGTYVINKQSSVCEIWLSSPVSGPYHFRNSCEKNSAKKWLAKDGEDLFEVLNQDLKIPINLRY